MPSPTIPHTRIGACYAAHPVTCGRRRFHAFPAFGGGASPPLHTAAPSHHHAAPDPAAPPGSGPDPIPPDDPVGTALGLLALAVDVCAAEVAHLLARPTPSARRPGPVVRFVGPTAA